MHGVDLLQKFCGSYFPISIVQARPAGKITPLGVLETVKLDQAVLLLRRGVLIPRHAGIHTVSKSAIDQVDLALLLLFVPHQISAALFADLTVDDPVAISGHLFCLGDKAFPTVLAAGNALLVLVEVQYEFQQEKTIGGGSAESQRHLTQRDLVGRYTGLCYIRIDFP